jgi:integrase
MLGRRERVMFWLATGGGGLRPSEIQGLKRCDIKIDRISIERRVYRGKVGRPKNLKSERIVPLTPQMKSLLNEYLELLIDDSPDAWLFPSENLKTSLSYSNVYRRSIRPVLDACGLKGINYQAMRRTFSSEADADGMDAKARSDIMGHSVDVNVNVYTQKDFESKEKAMQKLEKRLLQ